MTKVSKLDNPELEEQGKQALMHVNISWYHLYGGQFDKIPIKISKYDAAIPFLEILLTYVPAHVQIFTEAQLVVGKG